MICPSCGANDYFQDNWSRIVEENDRLRRELSLEAERHAATRVMHRIKELEADTRETWAQGKVARQREALRALEESRKDTQ